MELEGEQITQATNPFKIEPNTERVLAYGERARELASLNQNKYELVQKIADNKNYVDNLSRKRLHINGDRTGLISDVKQITKIPHLAPHINTKKTRLSPSPGRELTDSVKKKLGPIATRSRSIQPRRNGGQSVTLVPIMESIGASISPAHGGGHNSSETFNLTEAPTAARTSRFMTPTARDTVSLEDMPSTSFKYLHAGKLEKETIKDYISSTRKMLRKNLTNEARKRDLSQVKITYNAEKEKLRKEIDAFDEDH